MPPFFAAAKQWKLLLLKVQTLDNRWSNAQAANIDMLKDIIISNLNSCNYGVPWFKNITVLYLGQMLSVTTTGKVITGNWFVGFDLYVLTYLDDQLPVC